jgi:hypothetical protein
MWIVTIIIMELDLSNCLAPSIYNQERATTCTVDHIKVI